MVDLDNTRRISVTANYFLGDIDHSIISTLNNKVFKSSCYKCYGITNPNLFGHESKRYDSVCENVLHICWPMSDHASFPWELFICLIFAHMRINVDMVLFDNATQTKSLIFKRMTRGRKYENIRLKEIRSCLLSIPWHVGLTPSHSPEEGQ